jgi:hypothetical protein
LVTVIRDKIRSETAAIIFVNLMLRFKIHQTIMVDYVGLKEQIPSVSSATTHASTGLLLAQKVRLLNVDAA